MTRATTDQTERNVGAQTCCSLEIDKPSPAKNRGRIGGATPKTRSGRDALVDRNCRIAVDQPERSDDEVVVVGTHGVGTSRTLDREPRTAADIKQVVEIERDHLGVNEVIPVVS